MLATMLRAAQLLLLVSSATGAYPFNNDSLPAAARAADLLSRLSLEEKIGMTFMQADMAYGNDTIECRTGCGGDLPSTNVSRLGVPMFNWMSQGNVFRGASNGCNINCCSCYDGHNMSNCCVDGVATQFPQGTGWAATFNAPLAFAAGVAISDESRALNNHWPNKTVDYRTGASSVINILRDSSYQFFHHSYICFCEVSRFEVVILRAISSSELSSTILSTPAECIPSTCWLSDNLS